MDLLDWQVPIADRAETELRKGPVFVLGACTGAGKTYVCCETIRRLNMPALVVAPKVSLTQWRKVIEGFGIERLVIDVINPEKISTPRGCRYYTREGGWANVPYPCLLVVDEIHRGCSSHDSVTTNAVVHFGAKKVRPDNKLLALSATVADNPFKLGAIGYWMGFHRFVSSSWFEWLRAHGCEMRDVGWGRNRRRIFAFTTNRAKAQAHMSAIRDDMGTRFLSVTPKEIPGFPEEVVDVLRLDLAKKDRDALERAYAEMPKEFKATSEDDMVNTLRLREQAEFCKAEAIAEQAAKDEEDGLSVFILVNFTATRTRIEEYMRRKGVEYASIYGGQGERERQAGIDAFQRNDTHVLVAMAAAASCALSAHDERHERMRVSYISPGYNASDVRQGLGRIRRAGGTAVVQHLVLAADSVEERVARTLERKLACIDTLNDGDLMR